MSTQIREVISTQIREVMSTQIREVMSTQIREVMSTQIREVMSTQIREVISTQIREVISTQILFAERGAVDNGRVHSDCQPYRCRRILRPDTTVSSSSVFLAKSFEFIIFWSELGFFLGKWGRFPSNTVTACLCGWCMLGCCWHSPV